MKKLLIAAFAAVLCLASCTTTTEQTPGDVIYEMNVRQYTPEGTFAAAEQQLPRLKELGVDIVWLMPIYEIGVKERKGTLGSYYAIRDYKSVNPEFGDLAAFDSFVAKAHSLGLKVVLDWVANHTSPDAAWVTEKDPSWYYRDANGNTMVEYDWTDIAKLDYSNPEVGEAVKDAMFFWLDRGIDGFRCDMAYIVPQAFWTDAISSCRAKYGDLYFLAEGEEPWLHDAGFNVTYAWRLHHLMNDVAQGKATAADIAAYVEEDAVRFPAPDRRLFFTSNHDENSWSGSEIERMGDAHKVFAVLCYTLPAGEPLIYTGQEIGLERRLEFFEKDPIAAWTNDPHTAFYQELNALRHSHKALTEGTYTLCTDTPEGVLAFVRQAGSDWVKVTLNLTDELALYDGLRLEPWGWDIKTKTIPAAVVSVPDARIEQVNRVEPLSWWVGMTTPLQLLVQGPEISEYAVTLEGSKGVKITDIHKAGSPNYLFVDVQVSPKATPGTYYLVFTKGEESFKVPYEIAARREGSAERKSFTTADFIYLIMPDRFVDAAPNKVTRNMEAVDKDAFFGRHGGDIAGIASQLDYMAELGVTALWNTPLLEDNQPVHSYHGYACTDYYHIDQRFGSNDEYRELTREAHEKGIKMIMDMVPNHCGSAHWWMADLPFADWIHVFDEYTHSNCSFAVLNDPYASEIDRYNMESGWFDVSMPDMNLDNPYVLQYFKQWAVWWIEYADLDGLRVDTYPYNEKYPMSEWCKAVRAEYPNINIVGEVWTVNVPQLAYWQADNPNKDGFNSNLPAIMDFPLQAAICQGIPAEKVWWDEGMVRIYDAVSNDQYYHDMSNMMIFPGNHDTDRIADVIGADPARQKIVMTLMATLRGIPQLLYADELMAVSRDRSQGHGGLRIDFPLDWAFSPVARDVHNYTATLFNWRKTATAIHNGKTKHFLRRENTYAYFRYNDEQTVFVFINNTRSEVVVPWADYAEIASDLKIGRNVVTGGSVDVTAPIKVGPLSSIVVEFKK